MALSSISSLKLDINAAPTPGSLEKVIKLRQELERLIEIQKMSGKSGGAFAGIGNISQAGNAIDNLKSRLGALQKAKDAIYAKKELTSGVLGFSDKDKQDLAAINREMQFTQSLRNKFVNEYGKSQANLNALDAKRQSMMRQSSEMSAKTYKIPELSQQYKDIFAGLQNINVATVKGQAALAKYNKALQATNQAYQKHIAQSNMFTRSWEKFKQIFERVRDALVSFVIISGIQRIVTGFFTSLINSNQQLEVLRARLKALVPSSEEVKVIWDELKRLTITTPFQIQDFVQAATMVKAFGVDIQSNMETIADWASAVGKDLNDTAIAFGKIASFSPRTALLLSTRGFSLSMFESYVAKFGDRTIALRNMIEDQFGGMASRVSLTFKGILSNLNDLWVFISQVIGQPLFESLKSDLKVIYSLMDTVRKKGEGMLSFFGEITNLFVHGLGIGIFSVTLSLVMVQLMKFLAALRASKDMMAMWVGSLGTSVAIAGIGLLVWQLLKAADATKRLTELQKEYNTVVRMSTEKQISNLEEQISILEDTIGFWDVLVSRVNDFLQALSFISGFSDKPPDLHSFFHELNLRKENLQNLKKELELKEKIRFNEKLARIESMGKVSDLQDKDLLEKVQKLGLQDFFKTLAESAKKNIPLIEDGLKKIADAKKRWRLSHPLSTMDEMPTITTDIQGIQYTEKELSLMKAQINMRVELNSGLTQGYSKEKAIIKIKEMLIEQNKNLTRELLGGEQAAANYRDNIQALLEMLDEETGTAKAAEKLKNLTDRFKDLLGKIAGERSQFKGFFQDEDTTKISKMAEIYGRLQFEMGRKNLTMADFENQFLEKKKLQAEFDAASLEKKEKMVDALDKELEIDQLINQYLQYRFDTETKIKDMVQTYNDKLIDIANSYGDLSRAALEARYAMSDISTEEYLNKLIGEKTKLELDNKKVQEDRLSIQNELDNTNNPLRRLKLENDLADIEKKRVKNLQDLLSIIQQIFSLPSTNWGDAFFKQFVRLRNETEKWKDDIVDVFSTTLSTAISDSIREIISGTEAAGISSQISDLQGQLVEARNKKAEILGLQMQTTIVEDEEAKILAQINDLESQRANIILNKFLTVFDEVFKKVEEIAANKIVMWLMGGLGMDSPLKAQMAEVEAIYVAANAGAIGLVALDSQDYIIALDRLAVEQQIASAKGYGWQNAFNILKNINSGGGGGFEDYLNAGGSGNPMSGGLPGGRTRANAPIERTLTPAVSSSGKIVQVVFNGPIYGQKDFNKAVDEATRKIRSKVV